MREIIQEYGEYLIVVLIGIAILLGLEKLTGGLARSIQLFANSLC